MYSIKYPTGYNGFNLKFPVACFSFKARRAAEI